MAILESLLDSKHGVSREAELCPASRRSRTAIYKELLLSAYPLRGSLLRSLADWRVRQQNSETLG
jgi:hypothetical protein